MEDTHLEKIRHYKGDFNDWRSYIKGRVKRKILSLDEFVVLNKKKQNETNK